MTSAAASNRVPGASAYHAAHRLSGKGLAAIAAAHVGVLAVLASLDVVPLPAPVATLMVQVIPPAAAPAPEVVPPRPKPVERRPAPQPRPVTQPQTLATQAPAPSAAAEAPVAKEAPPAPPAAPAPAPAAPTVSQPRFDADYLSNPAPAYPSLSRRLGEEGKVLLRVFVEPAGRPSQVEIKASSGSPRLDQAAQEAVWRWKFIPARRGDEAVGAWVQVPIVFNLRG
ncbi:MAG TPA: energy transducer TonB [Rhodocyclaceae bacterium]|nr:energy transducer TonB [Rhodocyclaceae bacterium]